MDNNIEIKLIGNIIEAEDSEPQNLSGKISSGLNTINVQEMWKKNIKGKGVKIAVIDTGCDVNHKNFAGRIAEGRNFTSEDGGKPDKYFDYNGHGTHVAGIIAADTQGTDIVGVAPEAELIILKVLTKNGSGTVDSLIEAFRYAISRKADIISMSLGTKQPLPEVQKLIKQANEKGILVVCAAGNEGDNNKDTDEISYPGGYNEVISVGAVNESRGAAEFSNSNKEIDVAAPGVQIISTYPDNKYASLSGTSMAAPFVSGALALIIQWSTMEFGRRLSEAELYGQLIKNTTALNIPRTMQGNGIVDFTNIDR